MFLAVVWVRMDTPRFREPLEPFLVILAACALVAVPARLDGQLFAAQARRMLRGRVGLTSR
jgi:hypothetical protein